jgi:hypothetical protein
MDCQAMEELGSSPTYSVIGNVVGRLGWSPTMPWLPNGELAPVPLETLRDYGLNPTWRVGP